MKELSLRAKTIWALALSIVILTSAGNAAAQCDKKTDADIVAEIYGKIKADKGLASQISHINVVSIYAAVKFQGWANNQTDHNKIKGFGLNTDCVKLVNVNDFAETPPPTEDRLRSDGGCAAGTKACGDVCIPEGDKCSIGEFKAFVPRLFYFDSDATASLFTAGTGCN